MSNTQQQLQQPPQWAIDFLHWFCKSELVEEIEGDILEIYNDNQKTWKNLLKWAKSKGFKE